MNEYGKALLVPDEYQKKLFCIKFQADKHFFASSARIKRQNHIELLKFCSEASTTLISSGVRP